MSTTEKKTINYNGMELPCIESGYWPNGETLVCGDSPNGETEITGVVCLQSERAFSSNAGVSARYLFWAILPQKPAARRLTNRETLGLCRKGYDIDILGMVGATFWYTKNQDDEYVSDGTRLRAPNTDEWLEPTTDLLEVGK